MKASFCGLFKTNFYGHIRKLFLFTKFEFLNFGKKFFLTALKSTCLEFCASNYIDIIRLFYQNMYKHYYILVKSVSRFTLMVTKTY